MINNLNTATDAATTQNPLPKWNSVRILARETGVAKTTPCVARTTALVSMTCLEMRPKHKNCGGSKLSHVERLASTDRGCSASGKFGCPKSVEMPMSRLQKSCHQENANKYFNFNRIAPTAAVRRLKIPCQIVPNRATNHETAGVVRQFHD